MTAATLLALVYALVYWLVLFGAVMLALIAGRFIYEVWQDRRA